MGNAQSPPADPRYTTASRAFTKQELEDLKSLFVSLAAQSHSSTRFVSPSVFKAYFGINGGLGDRMFDLVTNQRKDEKLTFEDFVISKGTYEKGSREEIEEFIYQLCDVTVYSRIVYKANGTGGGSDLQTVLASMMEALFALDSGKSGSESAFVNIDIFLNPATFSEEGGNPQCMSFINFKKWLGFLPSARKLLGSLLMSPDPGRPGFQVPRLLHPEALSPDLLILKREFAWHIAGALSQHELDEWKLLYHSSVNGLSFTTFLAGLSDGCGPTVLVIKDKEGFIYGGYASQPWEKHGDFYGDMKSFIFRLYPQASIFRPTGANSNIQWCAVNFSSDSIPNGIGFGGKANHFGLFLSASLEQGHSYTCSTFDSPCLSSTNIIQPEVIECWAVLPKTGLQDEQTELRKGTVLERYKEDRNMLKMVGLASSSE